jgi:hypothetical protein
MEQTRVESWRTMEVEPIYQELAEQIEGEPSWAIPRLLKPWRRERADIDRSDPASGSGEVWRGDCPRD